jgi:hypothetical protein
MIVAGGLILKRILLIALSTAILAGCASRGADSPDTGITENFTVSTDYQAAYRRANDYFRVCYVDHAHRYNVKYVSKQGIDEKGTTAEARLALAHEPKKTLEVFSSRPSVDNREVAQATLRVLGEGRWNKAELAAAKQSIQTATPVCLSDDQ